VLRKAGHVIPRLTPGQDDRTPVVRSSQRVTVAYQSQSMGLM
jgi:hypothetical protein